MAVVSTREVIPRTYQMKMGANPTATITYACTLDGTATTNAQIQTACNVQQGAAHPEMPYLVALESTVTQPDPYHAICTYKYGVPVGSADEFTPSPLTRPDIWSYSTTGATIATSHYYPEGEDDVQTLADGTSPLVNSASDELFGVQTQVGELKVSIKGNRQSFDFAEATAVTGAINNDTYLGGEQYCWQCQGISGEPRTEIVNNVQYKFYVVQVSLVYRQQGFVAKLLDTGMNVLKEEESEGTGESTGKLVKQQATVKNAKGIDVPASQPVALNEDGTQMEPDGEGKTPPRTLMRRLHKAIAFNSYFGTPPT